MSYTEADFEKFWLGEDGHVWKLLGYSELPTVTFVRVDDPTIRRGGAVGSPIVRGFRELRPLGNEDEL